MTTAAKPHVSAHQGLDFKAKYQDVRRIVWRHPYFRVGVYRREMEPDDLVQQVFLGLLIRQRGRGRFNPERASFGRYVYLVTSSVLSNSLRIGLKERYERVGMYLTDVSGTSRESTMLKGEDISRQSCDAALAPLEADDAGDEQHVIEAVLAEAPTDLFPIVEALLLSWSRRRDLEERWGKERVAEALAEIRASLERRLS